MFVVLCLLILQVPSLSSGFIPYWNTRGASSTTSKTTKSCLWYELENSKNSNNENNENESEEDEARRMAVVRSLQMSFYKPSAEKSTTTSTSTSSSITDTPTYLDETTGIIHNLPLWRAPWQEVPGRSNVLNVHDPTYTSMFESILYSQSQQQQSNQQLIFGHLFLEGGSRNLSPKKVSTKKYQLQTYNDIISTTSNATITSSSTSSTSTSSSSAVLGCLMYVQDYRRMADGRLLLLVYAMERFIVTKVHQQLPYSIVDVQLLPDDSNGNDDSYSTGTGDDTTNNNNKELIASQRRIHTIQQNMKYQSYEYDPNQTLQLPNGPKVAVKHVSYDAMAKVLPFCPYNNNPYNYDNDDDDHLQQQQQQLVQDQNDNNDIMSMEYQLLRNGILKVPPSDPEFTNLFKDLSTNLLEYELWIAIQQYLIVARKPISPALLTLLPPSKFVVDEDNNSDQGETTTLWPDDFVLHKIAHSLRSDNTTRTCTIGGVTTISEHTYVPLSEQYPASRRQRRLSFSAAYLLETGDEPEKAQQSRAELLSIPSTHQRLKVVLERFYQWQATHDLGQFE